MTTRASLIERYATKGWAVFPCKPGGKHPATRSGVYAGTTDLVTLRNWWRQTDYNIGIWTGASGLVVIDCDLFHADQAPWWQGGPEPGIAAWCQMCKDFGTEPFDTYCVTTPSNGLHAYYIVPEDADIRPSAGKIAPMIDVRGGPSYVVAAGSETPDGLYEEVTDQGVAPCPAWLLEMVRYKPPTDTDILESAIRNSRQAMDPNTMVGKALLELSSARAGIRNETLNWVAYRLFRWLDHGIHREVEDQLIDHARMIGLSEQESRWTCTSAHRAACGR